MLLQMALFHSFLWLSSIPFKTLLLYSFICWWMPGCFYVFVIVNSAASDMQMIPPLLQKLKRSLLIKVKEE